MNVVKPIEVYPENDYFLQIKFSDGKIGKFDCKPYLNGEWFSELLNFDIFNSVRISGRTVEWSGGQDICPDCLYKNCI